MIISSVEEKLVLVSKELGEFSYSVKLAGIANENVRTVLLAIPANLTE
jgi:hypothetical protein